MNQSTWRSLLRTDPRPVREQRSETTSPIRSRRPLPALLQVLFLVCALACPRPAAATGCTLPLADGGGPVYLNTEVVLIFWGSYWTTSPAPNPSAGMNIGSVQFLLNSPYLSKLNQYRNAGLARMVPTVTFYSGTEPPSKPGGADVQNLVGTLLSNNAVPPPSHYSDMLYVVYVPPNGQAGSTAGSFHTTGRYGSSISYAIAEISDAGSGGLGVGSSFSHELAEVISDPFLNAIGDGENGKNCEIADVCGVPVHYGPYLADAYWSAADQLCVVPTSWKGIYQYTSGTSWTQIDNRNVRQVYAGQYGLIATDTGNNDVASWYNGTPLSWATVPGQTSTSAGAMFAVGADSILRLSNDTMTISKGSATSSFATVSSSGGSAVYGDSALLATDYYGDLWQYTSSNGWGSGPIAGAADQFAGDGGGGIYALAWDHQSVWKYGGSGTSWSVIGGAANMLYAGGGAGGLAATTLDQYRNAFLYSSGTTWVPQGGAGYIFAVAWPSSGEQLFGITPSLGGGAYMSTDVTKTFPSWTQVWNPQTQGAIGKLVAGNGHLYATGGVNMTTSKFSG